MRDINPILLLLLFTIAFAWTPLRAAETAPAPRQQPAPELFRQPPADRRAPLALDPMALRARPVRINFDLLGGPGDDNDPRDPLPAITLNLFADERLVAVHQRTESLRAGGYGWVGTVEGDALSQVAIVVRKGIATGTILRRGKLYRIQPLKGDLHVIQELDLGAFPVSPNDGIEIPPAKRQADAEALADLPQADDGSVIDILVVYTPSARAAQGGTAAMENLIDLAVLETNTSYQNSAVTHQLRLVHTAEVNYTESGDFETDLNALTSRFDGEMDEVHDLRDTYGADLVALLNNSSQFCGIAWLTSSSIYAFSVTAYNCAAGNLTFGHEIGHNMGARHDWYVDATVDTPSYNHGHINLADRWRTVMSYNNKCSDSGPSCSRIMHFSNPTILFSGQSTGISGGTSTACTLGNLNNPDCDADNARVHRDRAVTVANFRQGVNFSLLVDPAEQAVCTGSDATFAVTVDLVGGASEPVTLSTSGLPGGLNAAFAANPLTPPQSTELTIAGTGSVASGAYPFTLLGNTAAGTESRQLQLSIHAPLNGVPVPTDPADGATDVPLAPSLAWSPVAGAASYDVQIASDAGFDNLVYTANVEDTSHTTADRLDSQTLYYWRVRAVNPCGAAAYSVTNSFTTGTAPAILLVDDDDNGPDVRNAYTGALDALVGSAGYDVWDTGNSDTNEPDADTLAVYQTVIWFSGDEFGGAAGPGTAGEAALTAFLNSSNRCLLISSQDYHYDKGVTPFMEEYLGVTSASDDVGQASVSGQGSIFAGLGPYALSYPFSDFSDVLVPGGSNVETAFQGNAGIAAVNKTGTTYQTAFFAFPFAALPTATAREAVLQAFLDACAPAGEPVAPVLSIAASNGDISLTWTDDPANESYVMHRSTLPFFVPGANTQLATLDAETATYVDEDAAGDPSVNYFYIVRAQRAGQSADSNEVGEIDYALNTSTDAYSLVGFPFPSATLVDAASLADALGGVATLLKWDADLQAFRFFAPPSTGDNFAVAAGDVVFAQANGDTSAVATMVGPVESIQYALLPEGYNFILLPLQRGDLTTASAVASDVGNVTTMLQWDEALQTFRFFAPPSTGDDFSVRPGQPMFLQMGSGGQTNWP